MRKGRRIPPVFQCLILGPYLADRFGSGMLCSTAIKER